MTCARSLRTVSYTHLDVYKRQVLFCVTKGGWGWDNFLAEADTGKGVKFPAWSKLWLKFGIPALIIIIFVMGYVPKFATWLGLS